MVLENGYEEPVREEVDVDETAHGGGFAGLEDDGLRVEPVDEDAEGFWLDFVELYFLICGFDEGAVEGCLEVGGVVADVVFVDGEGLVVCFVGVGDAFGGGVHFYFDDCLGAARGWMLGRGNTRYGWAVKADLHEVWTLPLSIWGFWR